MKSLKRISQGIALLFAIIVLYVLFWPVNIDPAAWTPPEAPELSGVYAENDLLRGVEKLAGGHYGPEAIAIDSNGNLYTGLLSDDRILRISPDGETIEIFAQAVEPAGMKSDTEGNLVVANATLGLILVDRNGNTSVLADHVNGILINFADDLAIASDGKIYLSDASTKFPNSEFYPNTTSAIEANGILYLGSHKTDGIGKFLFLQIPGYKINSNI